MYYMDIFLSSFSFYMDYMCVYMHVYSVLYTVYISFLFHYKFGIKPRRSYL